MSGSGKTDGILNLRNILLGLVILVASAIVFFVLWRPILGGERIAISDSHVHGAITDIGVRFDSSVRILNVRLGDQVKAGDTVALLRSGHLVARVSERRAEVARMSAEVEAAEIAIELSEQATSLSRSQSDEAVEAARAAVEATRASASLARAAYARDRQLLADGIIPRARLEAAREAVLVAEADVREAEAQLRLALAGTDIADVDVEQVRVLRAELVALQSEREAAESQLAIAEADLAAAVVSAPHDGQIVAVHAREGASVRPNDPIVSVWINRRAWIHAWVSEDDIVDVRKGSKAMVEVPAVGDRSFEGRVGAVMVAPDGMQTTLPGQPISPLLPDRPRFGVRIELPAEAIEAGMLPGMSARVLISRE